MTKPVYKDESRSILPMALSLWATLTLALVSIVGTIVIVVDLLFLHVLLPNWVVRRSVLVFLLTYYSYYYVFSRRRWPLYQELWYRLRNTYPYFNSIETIFDGGDETGQCFQPKSKTMLTFHPHGVFCLGWTLNGVTNRSFQQGNFNWLVTEALFIFPFISNLIAWLKCGPVNKTNFVNLLSNNENVALLPGGFQEATIFGKGEHRVYIKHRKGFIKYALEYGYKVHPIYTFGEEETFSAFQPWLNFRLWFNRFRIPAIAFFGEWFCFYMPHQNLELNTVVGKALTPPSLAGDSPTSEEVDEFHKEYMQALLDLFEKYKGKFAKDPNTKLVFY